MTLILLLRYIIAKAQLRKRATDQFFRFAIITIVAAQIAKNIRAGTHGGSDLNKGMARKRGYLKKSENIQAKSTLEELLALQLKAEKIAFVREYRFHPKRKWRFDFAIPDLKIGIECEGGIYSGGRHVTGKGYEADLEKYNAAIMEGYDVVRFSGSMIASGKALETIKLLINAKESNVKKQ